MLQRGPQRPSTNNSAGAEEPLKPGEQATSLPLSFLPFLRPHTQWDLCVPVRKYVIHKIQPRYKILTFLAL